MFADELDRLEREQFRYDGGYQVDRLEPVPTPQPVRPRGRPSTGFNKTVYMRDYMRKRRHGQKQTAADGGPGPLSAPARGQLAA